MTFKYFAYGSNLLTSRMRINCPTAVMKTIGMLKDFELVFWGYAESWKGAAATIKKSPGNHVWGVIWEISKDHEDCLNRQEHGYEQITVTVQTPNEEKLVCKSYQKIITESEVGFPSAVYKHVILNGAIEHELPADYIKELQNVKDNGYKGKVDIPVSIKL